MNTPLTGQPAPPNEQFIGLLRTALRRLYDNNALRTSPLVAIFGLMDEPDPSAALRQLLIAAIRALQPQAGTPADTLQDVPRSLYDAAMIDGANGFRRFWHVTIPMCSPVVLFNLVMGFIGGFQYFTMPWLLTQGGPNRATEFYSLHLYRNAFLFLRMGKAAALAWLLFVVVVVFTITLFKTSGRWVYYGGEAD